MGRKIIIAGGGIAGLVLGILLRKSGVEVDLFEAGVYPRHRVCGEFLSGRGATCLRDFQFAKQLSFATKRNVRFFIDGRPSRLFHLPEPALCISRYQLDSALAREFCEHGGNLILKKRWTGSFSDPGTIRATGRRLEREAGEFVGLKMHVSKVTATGLELYFSRAGYTGICPIENGVVNVCGLFRREHFQLDKSKPRDAFGPVIRKRLEDGETRMDSLCAVAGISTAPPRQQRGGFVLGDSISVIPPLTGNGMSLAIESAFLAAPLLLDFSLGKASWHETSERFSQLCKKRFYPRLRVSSFLQKLLLHPPTAHLFLSCLQTAPVLLNGLFRLTR